MYLRASPIWKFGVLVFVEYHQILFDGLIRGLFNLCETEPKITSCLTNGVKSSGLHVLGSLIVHMEAKEKLNIEYLDIDPTLFA